MFEAFKGWREHRRRKKRTKRILSLNSWLLRLRKCAKEVNDAEDQVQLSPTRENRVYRIALMDRLEYDLNLATYEGITSIEQAEAELDSLLEEVS